MGNDGIFSLIYITLGCGTFGIYQTSRFSLTFQCAFCLLEFRRIFWHISVLYNNATRIILHTYYTTLYTTHILLNVCTHTYFLYYVHPYTIFIQLFMGNHFLRDADDRCFRGSPPPTTCVRPVSKRPQQARARALAATAHYTACVHALLCSRGGPHRRRHDLDLFGDKNRMSFHFYFSTNRYCYIYIYIHIRVYMTYLVVERYKIYFGLIGSTVTFVCIPLAVLWLI